MIYLTEIIIYFAIFAYVAGLVIAFWIIFTKIGMNGAWGLLAILPLFNFVLLFYLAFSKWPIETKLKELQK